jgi:uncharacterized protein (TIGR04255 family)
MPSKTHYKNSAITEALIDVKVELAPNEGFAQLSNLRDKLISRYPEEQTTYIGQMTFSLLPETKATAQNEPYGLLFWTKDRKQAVQVKRDGFTFSRLPPYESWEKLQIEAKNLWQIYQETLTVKKITRVASRYVNQFDLPGTRVEPEDYLNTYPRLSKDLPKERSDFGPFWMRLELFQEDLKAKLVISEGSAPPKKPEAVAILLDLDIFIENPEIRDGDALWNLLQQLHERMYLYFEASITDKIRELIR